MKKQKNRRNLQANRLPKETNKKEKVLSGVGKCEICFMSAKIQTQFSNKEKVMNH